MSLSVCSRSSARATLGSYSISACSWVKLTATLSTPGRLPSAFSIVPVHNEQCSPPIRARIRRRPGSLEGSSLQKRGADSMLAAVLTRIPPYQWQGLSQGSPGHRIPFHSHKMNLIPTIGSKKSFGPRRALPVLVPHGCRSVGRLLPNGRELRARLAPRPYRHWF